MKQLLKKIYESSVVQTIIFIVGFPFWMWMFFRVIKYHDDEILECYMDDKTMMPCQVDGGSCDQINTSGMTMPDCEDCLRTKIARRYNETVVI